MPLLFSFKFKYLRNATNWKNTKYIRQLFLHFIEAKIYFLRHHITVWRLMMLLCRLYKQIAWDCKVWYCRFTRVLQHLQLRHCACSLLPAFSPLYACATMKCGRLHKLYAFMLSYCTLQRQNGENLKQIFPEKEYRGLSPNFHIHLSVSELYIPTMGLPVLLEEICRLILGLYKSLKDTWMWKLGLRPRYSQKRNI